MSRAPTHTHVKLVRHTQTDWNKQGRYQSFSDRALTEFGEARAAAVARSLRRSSYTGILSTGLYRTDTLATRVAADQDATPNVSEDERWREVDHGRWEGLTHAEVAERHSEEARSRFADFWNSRAHGGESGSDLWGRVEAAWKDLLQRNVGGRVLLVAHGAPIRLLLCALLGIPLDRHWQLRTDLGGVTALDIYPTGNILRTFNEVPPLTETGAFAEAGGDEAND